MGRLTDKVQTAAFLPCDESPRRGFMTAELLLQGLSEGR